MSGEVLGDCPEDWEPENEGCENCYWILENYRREDLEIFRAPILDGAVHVINKIGTRPKRT